MGSGDTNLYPPFSQSREMNDYGLCDSVDPKKFTVIYDDIKDMYSNNSLVPSY